MNLVIIVSLIAIGLALVIGYAYGFRKGAEDAKQEAEQRHGYIASRQLSNSLWRSRN